ncbi:MAG TPA: ATP-binding protein [Solirubrobacteraceae bacterium]|nr:ATP-binding protein [Solirubrobacteraceae bacterium]
MEQFSVEADLVGGPHAAARARRFVEDELLQRLPRRVVEDVMLLITELVANGVRHGGAGVDSTLHLLLQGTRPGLRVEVVNADRRGGRGPARRAADLTGGGGIGLNLVDRLSSRWGVRQTPDTAVWFELDC